MQELMQIGQEHKRGIWILLQGDVPCIMQDTTDGGNNMPKRMTTLGQRLLTAREKAGLSQERAARALANQLPEMFQLSSTSLGRIENGKIVRPDPVAVAGLCAVYGATMDLVDPEGAAALAGATDGVVATLRSRGDLHTHQKTCLSVNAAWLSGMPLAAA